MIKSPELVDRPQRKSQSELMPHVIVKLWPGKSERQKQQLADAITRDVMENQTRFKPADL
jgi:hypothetical protein